MYSYCLKIRNLKIKQIFNSLPKLIHSFIQYLSNIYYMSNIMQHFINIDYARFSIVKLALIWPHFSCREEDQAYMCKNSFTLLLLVRATNGRFSSDTFRRQALFLQWQQHSGSRDHLQWLFLTLRSLSGIPCCEQTANITSREFPWISVWEEWGLPEKSPTMMMFISD